MEQHALPHSAPNFNSHLRKASVQNAHHMNIKTSKITPNVLGNNASTENQSRSMPLVNLVKTLISRTYKTIQSVLQDGNRDAQEGRKYWLMVTAKHALQRWNETRTTLVEAAESQCVKINLMFQTRLSASNVHTSTFKTQRTLPNAFVKYALPSK